MIVLDTSVFVDAIIPFDAKRHILASKLIDTISAKGLRLYEPQPLAIELSGVLAMQPTPLDLAALALATTLEKIHKANNSAKKPSFMNTKTETRTGT